MGAYLRVGAYSTGRLFNNFLDRVSAYSRGALIRGGAYSRIYGNELLTKMLGSMDIATNTKTILYLQRVLCVCKDLPGWKPTS